MLATVIVNGLILIDANPWVKPRFTNNTNYDSLFKNITEKADEAHDYNAF